MPIYAYRCDSCGQAREVLQKHSDPVLVTCPSCGAPALRKQLTAAGFQLKGSGWYVTDFKGGSAPAKGETAAEGETKATGELASNGAASDTRKTVNSPPSGASAEPVANKTTPPAA